ncbi:g9257 [Coccomyxa elongata]
MQMVFEAEYLQLQAGGFLDLLQSLSPRNPAFTKYVWEACLMIVKAHITSRGIVAFLHRDLVAQLSHYSTQIGFPTDPILHVPPPPPGHMLGGSWANVAYTLQILSPLIHMQTLDFTGAQFDMYLRLGRRALGYLEQSSQHVRPALWLNGLKMEAVEVVYRLHLSLAYQTRRDHMEELLANTMRIVELAPVNPLNARMYAHMPAVPVTEKYQTALEAHKNNDEVALSVLMWELCHNILLGGNGPHVKITDVLQMVDQAQKYVRLSESWGGQQIMTCHAYIYWRCMAVAISYRTQGGPVLRDVFASEQELQDQVKTIRDEEPSIRELLAGCQDILDQVL